MYALRPFRLGINRLTVSDWYLRPEEYDLASQAEISNRVDSIVRRVIALVDKLDNTPRGQLHLLDNDITFHFYNVRNAVLAHAAVMSTGNLFAIVVPAFEHVAQSLAIAGWARRSGAPFDEARIAAGVLP